MKVNALTKDELIEKIGNVEIENAQIEKIDIEVIGHFGNAIMLYIPIKFKGNMFVFPFRGISSTFSSGYIIQSLFEIFDIHEDDGIKLSTFKNYPCRIVFKDDKIVAIGNFMSDKFLIIEDIYSSFKAYIKNYCKE